MPHSLPTLAPSTPRAPRGRAAQGSEPGTGLSWACPCFPASQEVLLGRPGRHKWLWRTLHDAWPRQAGAVLSPGLYQMACAPAPPPGLLEPGEGCRRNSSDSHQRSSVRNECPVMVQKGCPVQEGQRDTCTGQGKFSSRATHTPDAEG